MVEVNAVEFAPCDHCGTEARFCSTFDVLNHTISFESTRGCCPECGHAKKQV
jgi:hypothetical protein